MIPIVKPISVVLKEARQNKGVSLEEVHKATKIHPKILRALEDGTTLGLSHVYVKSYAKIYAKYLGISQHELDKYSHSAVVSKEKKPRLDIPFNKAKDIKIKSLSRTSLLSRIGFNIKLLQHNKNIVMIFIIAFFLLALLTIFLRKSHKSDAVILGKVRLDKAIAASKASVKKDNKTQEVREIFSSKIGDVLRLTIFAKEDTWMQIKKDGAIVFKNTLKKDTSETWQANESLELWIANAGTIKLELNGKVLEPLGRRGQLLKSVLITKEGLVIKK